MTCSVNAREVGGNIVFVAALAVVGQRDGVAAVERHDAELTALRDFVEIDLLQAHADGRDERAGAHGSYIRHLRRPEQIQESAGGWNETRGIPANRDADHDTNERFPAAHIGV